MPIGEAVHDKYRGRAVGLVLTGWESPLGRGADFHKPHLLSVLRPPYLWAAIKVSLTVNGAQNGGDALSVWLPIQEGARAVGDKRRQLSAAAQPAH